MDPFEAIKKERKAAKVLCGTTKDAKSVAALATAFGLKGDASLYHQVDAEMAPPNPGQRPAPRPRLREPAAVARARRGAGRAGDATGSQTPASAS